MNKEIAFFKTKGQILVVLSVIVVIGYIIDLFELKSDINTYWTNFVSIGFVVAALLLTYKSIVSVKQSFSIIVYSLILNVLVSYIFDLEISINLEAEFLRSALIIGMILPIAGFVIEKKHTLYVGALLLVFFVIVIITSHNNYIDQNFYLLTTVFIGYTLGMYYILYMLENSTLKQSQLIAELEEKNNELEGTNALLSELNGHIEIQKEELRNTVESREKLLTIISHDIKNPLSTIINFSDLIKSKISAPEHESVLLYTNMIQESANNLNKLIVNLLDWTRLQGGKLVVKKGLFDAGTKITDAINLHVHSLNHKKIELVTNNIEGKNIIADRHMFSAVVRNLISNAVKFTPVGGKINIESKIENNKYFFSISDTGVGMNSEDIQTILYGQKNITSAGTMGESGTGFGLELCKEFIKLHEGELNIKSQLGLGTEFIVCLPVDYSN